jgi:hypothetical protein
MQSRATGRARADGPNGVWVNGGTPNGDLRSVRCVTSTFCEAVGSFYDDASDVRSLAELWIGTSWALQTTPVPKGAAFSAFDDVSCISASWCIAVGSSSTDGSGYQGSALAELWNGKTWTVQRVVDQTGALSDSLGGISCVSTKFCEAVGNYWNATDAILTLTEVWNGKTWAIQVQPPKPANVSFLVSVSCVAPNACEAVGEHQGPREPAVSLGEWWNGKKWSIQKRPIFAGTDTYFNSVSCISANDCEAVGAYSPPGDAGQTILAEVWNGTAWSVQTMPSIATSFNGLWAVSCSAGKACEAVGFQGGEATDATLAEGWNGTTWSVQKTPDKSGALAGDHGLLTGVACPTNVGCEATAEYPSPMPDSPDLTGADSWNGTVWSTQKIPGATN